MIARFDEGTSDICLIVNEEEVKKLKRTRDSSPVIESTEKNRVFNLMSADVSDQDFITVKEPNPGYNQYWIKMGDSAYNELERYGRCGTRFGNSSKVNICQEG